MREVKCAFVRTSGAFSQGLLLSPECTLLACAAGITFTAAIATVLDCRSATSRAAAASPVV